MNKKGFSLVELMGIIIILSLISLLVIPSIDRSIKSFKLKAYESQIQNIRLSAKDWVIDNLGKYALNEGETLTISLSQLKVGGYLEEEFINPNTDTPFPDDMQINITRNEDALSYFIIDSSGSETGLTYNAPLINLNGDYIERIPLTSTYTEKGVVVKDYNGNVIVSPALTTVITNSTGTVIGSIPTVTAGTYTVRYGITHSGITRYIYRLVIVN
jgi:competence protein ComGC